MEERNVGGGIEVWAGPFKKTRSLHDENKMGTGKRAVRSVRRDMIAHREKRLQQRHA